MWFVILLGIFRVRFWQRQVDSSITVRAAGWRDVWESMGVKKGL